MQKISIFIQLLQNIYVFFQSGEYNLLSLEMLIEPLCIDMWAG